MGKIDMPAMGMRPARFTVAHTPPPLRENTKVPKFDGNNPSCCSDKAVVHGCCEKTQAVRAKQSSIEVLGHDNGRVGATSGMAETSIHKIPSLSSKSPKRCHLQGPQENGTAKFHGSHSCRNDTLCCSHGRCSRKGVLSRL